MFVLVDTAAFIRCFQNCSRPAGSSSSSEASKLSLSFYLVEPRTRLNGQLKWLSSALELPTKGFKSMTLKNPSQRSCPSTKLCLYHH